MAENTEILPVKKDADLGSSYTEFMRQFQIAEDEALINEAFIVEEDLEEQPDVMPLPGDTDLDTDFVENKPAEELGALGIAQQILFGGPLDAVVNAGELITDTGERIRNFEIGGATVEQHLQALDQTLGTGELFSGKVELPMGSIEPEGGAVVQLGRGLMSWLTGFAMLRTAGAGNITSGIAADGLVVERDANLSNLFNEAFPEGHPLRNPLTDLIAVDQDDTELEKSIKTMVEGFGLSLPFTAVQALSKSLSEFKASRLKAKKVAARNAAKAEKAEAKAAAKDKFDIPPSPKPTGPKVFATFEGETFNITDMELRFDEVNPTGKISKLEEKFADLPPNEKLNKKGRKKRTLIQTELEARKELQADPEGQLKELLEKDPTVELTDKDRIKWELLDKHPCENLLN